ncbi:uncharacterized protein MEPE_03744 [Melanopsichium pennsylvanicum]|uniref:Uncharacterized protein n=1 Tax=Melanopsichium pennsylvanicum TaxID=63383 RepID=A0AAJ5C5S2_9BASI|nr:uncharacterized protein MEPE_03744 [Melanopsichium pennsylvanicum]
MLPTLLFTSFSFGFITVISFIIPRSAASHETQQAQSPPSPAFPIVYSPVELSQLCSKGENYCVYIDLVRRGGDVLANPVNATDNQGAFLFERKTYLDTPFHICHGGCCVHIDFDKQQDCVSLSYHDHPTGESGHLLARFADNVQKFIGPGKYTEKKLTTCSDQDQNKQDHGRLPYAVISGRGGPKKVTNHGQEHDQGNFNSGSTDANSGSNKVSSSNGNSDDNTTSDHTENSRTGTTITELSLHHKYVQQHPVQYQSNKNHDLVPLNAFIQNVNHNYFDDVTVSHLDS